MNIIVNVVYNNSALQIYTIQI